MLAELHRGLGREGDEDRLFALAELSFLHGEQTGDRPHFLAAAVYAYALLFPGPERNVRMPGSDPRLRLAYDLYNQGLAQGLAAPRGDGGAAGSALDVTNEDLREIRLEGGTRALPFGTLEIDLDPSGPLLGGLSAPSVHFDDHARGPRIEEPIPPPRPRGSSGGEPGAR